MNTIKIKQKVDTFTEIKLPYFGKTDYSYFCITHKDKYDNLRGMTVRANIPSISVLVLESEFLESETCTPDEFAAAWQEAHRNLKAKYEIVLPAHLKEVEP